MSKMKLILLQIQPMCPSCKNVFLLETCLPNRIPICGCRIDIRSSYVWVHPSPWVFLSVAGPENSFCGLSSRRLSLKWPLLSSNGLIFKCLKCIIEDVNSVEQVQSLYKHQSYGAYKQVKVRSSADKPANQVLGSTTKQTSHWHSTDMLWAEDNSKIPNNYLSELAQ